MFHFQINRLFKVVTLASLTAVLAVSWHTGASAQMCPQMGWQENLANYQKPTAVFPTQDTARLPTPDCNFHQWSAEAFVWATALDKNGVARFLTLPSVEQLLVKPALRSSGAKTGASASASAAPRLRLGMRSAAHAVASPTGAGAIVEADGSMLVGPNGYPVYASVHMNKAYFDTAKANMIKTGGYQKNTGTDAYFPVGAAVFKATWLRLDAGEAAPQGAFVTQAEVPKLSNQSANLNNALIAPNPNGETESVTVALVGLHVVGQTVNHPEFLWATFEHNLNAPRVADNTFSSSGSSQAGYTFYAKNTHYSQVNIYQPQTPPIGATPQLSFDQSTQKFAPIAAVVQLNATGGENQPQGAQNVLAVSRSMSGFFNYSSPSPAQALFANYLLNGTVWFAPNSYVKRNPKLVNLNASNAIGSVNLANSTAETFQQVASNVNMDKVQNCFMCHNAQMSSNAQFNPLRLKSRRIAISHVLGEGTSYAVPNLVNIPLLVNAK